MDKLKMLILSHARSFLKPASLRMLKSLSFADLCIYYVTVLRQRDCKGAAHDGVPSLSELAATKTTRDDPKNRRSAFWMSGLIDKVRRENLGCYCYLYSNTPLEKFEADNLQILINAGFNPTHDKFERRYR